MYDELTQVDIQKMREYDVAVGFCPRCNAHLGMGVAPLDEFRKAGLRIGLGTDSPAATDSGDMFPEMRIGLMVQRAVGGGRHFLAAHSMLEMATIGGARALRIDDKVGSLEVGKRADITAAPSVDEYLKGFKFRQEGRTAEAFDVDQDNINARTQFVEAGGVKMALLPKKTLGETR